MRALFTTDVLAHVRAHAPALADGAVDYPQALRDYSGHLDFYDSRDHLASLPGGVLADRVAVRAGTLTARGLLRGERVVMVAANDERYLTTLLAVLLIGAVPCAVAAPPTPGRADSAGVRHLRAAIRIVDPAMVLGPAATAIALPDAALVSYDQLTDEDAAAQPFPVLDWPVARPDDIHHLQLTSGSTSEPKAVLLSHANVAHNLGVLAHGIGADVRRDSMFSWLPMYHDMGLIQVLGGLVYRARVALMSPLGFLRDPLSWARHMSHHGSTVTAGPTFAYRAITDALGRSPKGLVDIDLSALRHAFVGAEPIDYETLRRFTDSFAPLGLRPEALIPCYGMAESVLATTLALGPAPDGPGNFGRIRIAPAPDGASPVVSCGRPIDGMQVLIVDADGAGVQPGTVGDIRISGPSLMAGYREADGTVNAPPQGWHDTGDRGFLCDGELFVTGRRKEMLIIRGRNLPPYDVERVIGELAGVGLGNAVVFSVPDQARGRERVVAVLGTAAEPGAGEQLTAAVTTRVREVFGFSLDDVVLIPRRAIPRTTSGKIQRLRLRERYLSADL